MGNKIISALPSNKAEQKETHSKINSESFQTPTLTFSDWFLREALLPDEKDQVNKWKKGSNHFSNKLFGGSDKDKETFQRKHFDFKSGEESPVKKEIESHLGQHGITVADYKAGLGKDKHGRDVRIGKALGKTNAHPDLVKKFNEDPLRSNKGQENLKVLISRHPHDVAGMTSCGQSWAGQSCMNFNSGSNKHKLKADLKHGTHVAYLVKTDDQGHPQEPLARVAIKKHINQDTKKHYTLEPEDRVYGNAPKEFRQQVQDILDREHNDHQPAGIYNKHKNVYDDSNKSYKLKIGKDVESAVNHVNPQMRTAAFEKGQGITPEHISKGLEDKEHSVRNAAISHSSATDEHISKALGDSHFLVRQSAIRNSNVKPHHIDKALSDTDDDVRARAANHSKATDEHISKALSDKSYMVRSHAASNKNAKAHHLDIAIGDSHSNVRANAISNPNAQAHHIDKVLKDQSVENRNARSIAVSHPNATEEHIQNGLQDKDSFVRAAVFEHPKIQSHHIDKGLDDSNLDVKKAAAKHPNLQPHHVDKALDYAETHQQLYGSQDVGMAAISHPTAVQPHHLDKALNHPNYQVKIRALQHPKIEPHHIDKGLNDEAEYTNIVALDHPKVQSHHLDKALTSQYSSVRSAAAAHPKAQSHHLDKALDDNNRFATDIRVQVLKRKDLKPHHIDKALNDEHGYIRELGINHSNATKDNIEKALTNKYSDTRINAIKKHPNLQSHHIDKALDDESVHVRNAVLDHPNVQAHHISKALKDPQWDIRTAAVKHKNATSDHIDAALGDSHYNVRSAAIRHPNATSAHIDRALNDSDYTVRMGALKHKNAEAHHVEKALSDNDADVRLHAAQHPKATAEHIHKALDDENGEVKLAAIRNPNVNSDHLHKAMKSSYWALKSDALAHPKISSDHLHKALSDEDRHVRMDAVNHPNAGKEHFEKALNDKHPEIQKIAQTRLRQLGIAKESMKLDSDLLLEIGNRWHEDYHDRAHKAALKSKPENVKKGAELLRKQMKDLGKRADFHQDVASEIFTKHDAESYDDIPDAHDRYRARHHHGMTDYYRRKAAGAFWAHSGLRKAAQERGLLKDDEDKRHYADFKEAFLNEAGMLKARGGAMPNAWWAARDAVKGKSHVEISHLRDKVRKKLEHAHAQHMIAKRNEESVFADLYHQHGDDFYEKPEADYGMAHFDAEKKAQAAHKRFHTLRAIEYGLDRAHDEAMTSKTKKLAKTWGGFSESKEIKK